MDLATLDHRPVEDLTHRGGERLGAVDHHQHRSSHVQTSIPEVGEQGLHDRRVLGRAFHQPERDLGAIDADPQRDDTEMLGEVDSNDQRSERVRGAEREFNTEIARQRVHVEHAIRRLKTNKILHGYRRRRDTLTDTLRACATLATLPA